jgi:spermidine synthase
LREVCRHQGVEHITQVEIDPTVIELSQQYLPNHSAGAFADPRLKLVIGDGYRFVQECEERYDVIISDSTDPEGPAEILFSSTFYEACKRCLSDGGIFVAQNGVAFMQPQEVIMSNQRLRSLFRDTSFYTASIPTYAGGQMMLAWASDNDTLRSLGTDVLTQRWRDTGIQSRYYTPQIHRAAFALPQYVLDMLG